MKPMEHYRVYRLDPAGHITQGENYQFTADAEAMAFAEGFCADAPAVEVWQNARFVGRFPCQVAAHDPAARAPNALFHRWPRPR